MLNGHEFPCLRVVTGLTEGGKNPYNQQVSQITKKTPDSISADAKVMSAINSIKRVAL
jgi:hypothetical protein